MNDRTEQTELRLAQAELGLEQREDREDRLPVGVVEKPAEPEQCRRRTTGNDGCEPSQSRIEGESRYGLISGTLPLHFWSPAMIHASSK